MGFVTNHPRITFWPGLSDKLVNARMFFHVQPAKYQGFEERNGGVLYHKFTNPTYGNIDTLVITDQEAKDLIEHGALITLWDEALTEGEGVSEYGSSLSSSGHTSSFSSS